MDIVLWCVWAVGILACGIAWVLVERRKSTAARLIDAIQAEVVAIGSEVRCIRLGGCKYHFTGMIHHWFSPMFSFKCMNCGRVRWAAEKDLTPGEV